MHLRCNQLQKIIVTVLFLWQWGCGHTESAKFYVLNSLTGSSAEIKTEESHTKLVLGIGPINLPEYLDRPHENCDDVKDLGEL